MVCLCVSLLSAVMREQAVDLGKTFQKDLQSIGSRSGPLPLWLWKRIVSDINMSSITSNVSCYILKQGNMPRLVEYTLIVGLLALQ